MVVLYNSLPSFSMEAQVWIMCTSRRCSRVVNAEGNYMSRPKLVEGNLAATVVGHAAPHGPKFSLTVGMSSTQLWMAVVQMSVRT